MKRAVLISATFFVFFTATAGSDEPWVPQPRTRQPLSGPVANETSDAEIAKLEARITEAPEDHHAWRELGWAYWNRDRLDLTRRTWETWRRLQPASADVHALLGRLALAENRLGAAITSFRRSLEVDPDQNDIRFELARTLRWKGHLTEAITRLQTLRIEQPWNEEIQRELARALSANWNYAQSLPLWTRLRANHPSDPELQMGEALAALHTGSPQSAVLDARHILKEDPDNLTALTLLADEAEFGGRPREAIPWVERLIAANDNPHERLFLQNRLLALWQRTATAPSLADNLKRQERLARQMMAAAPWNIDVRLTLSEILLRQQRHHEAETMLHEVLREFNPRHHRSHAMVFEIALAGNRFADARRHLETIRQFHPRDPYLNWHQARLHAAENDLDAAYRALDRLAAAGERGAVAVLLYHAITSSDYGPPLSAARFREHLLALMHAGYEFVTPEEIHNHWERPGADAGRTSDGRARRVVAITFDDGLESAMRFATPIGMEYGLRFSQHIIAGFVERGDPYLSSWEELARYAESGIWEYGSHLYHAHDMYDIDSSGMKGRPLAVRQWLENKQRLEAEQEYGLRIEQEYRKARELISERLGHPAGSVAYPYGDIGQEAASTMPDAIPINLQHAANQHTVGFIQTPFAHAVRGANPLLYSRHEMDIHWDGNRVVQYLIDHHPIILAERTRLQFAQWFNQPDIARDALDALRAAGYPALELDRMAAELRARMAPAFSMPVTAASDSQTPRFCGVTLDVSSDNLKARHVRASLQGGVAVHPDVHLSVAAGSGRLTQQRPAENAASETLALNEMRAQLLVSYLDPRHWVWKAGIGWRGWTGDANHNRIEYQVSVHGRPTPETALRADLRTETADRALAMADGLSRNQASIEAQWHVSTAWFVHGAGNWEQWSDNNRVLRLEAYPRYSPDVWKGYFTGVRMTHRQSQRDTSGIWTPYRFHGAYGVVGKRGRYAGGQYDVWLQAGTGRETAFPPDEDTSSDETAPDVRESPNRNGDWRDAYGVGIGWRPEMDRNWRINLRIDWNYNSNYDEGRMQFTLLRKF